jgi:hypothetical protein
MIHTFQHEYLTPNVIQDLRETRPVIRRCVVELLNALTKRFTDPRIKQLLNQRPELIVIQWQGIAFGEPESGRTAVPPMFVPVTN